MNRRLLGQLPVKQATVPFSERQLKLQSQTELNIARSVRRRADPADGAGNAYVGRRHRKVRMIQDVEKFRPELQVDTIGEPRILEHAGIPVEEAGAKQQISR